MFRTNFSAGAALEYGPTFTPPCFCRDFREAGVAVGPDSSAAPALKLVRQMAMSYIRASSGEIERAVMARNLGMLEDSVEDFNEQKPGKPLPRAKLGGYHSLKIPDLKNLLKKR